VTLAAPAKLNLRLEVGPRGGDGYHPLRTLLVAVDGLEDVVAVAPAAARRVSCPGVEGPANLAWRALDALEAEVGRPLPTAVAIEKRIPVQVGLGGGSSDAAATLVGADRLHGLGLGPEPLERVAARVGSDVPFFVRGGAQWAQGRGELLRPAEVPPFAAVLAKPPGGLSTAEVYRAFDRLPAPSPPAPRDVVARSRNDSQREHVVAGSRNDPYRDLVARSRNDLWPAALALAPRLGAVARALRAAGADAVVLCGSGSCVAGLFPDRERARAGARRLAGDGFSAVVTGPAAAREALSGGS
jgi:4-diphosphocytidyl-2-C-methyl-D-erythritol kinase